MTICVRNTSDATDTFTNKNDKSLRIIKLITCICILEMYDPTL